MKKQIMLTGLLVFSILSTIVAQHDHSSSMKKDMDMDEHMEKVKKYDVNSEFQVQLKAVLDSNQKLVDAFLNDDNERIKSAITELSAHLAKVDMSILARESHYKWMEYLNEMKPEVKQIILANDIGYQRIHLAKLNETLYKSLKSFGTGGNEIYYNYCPKANMVGANWLTTSNEIQNPYMGQKMPNCGSNKEVLN